MRKTKKPSAAGRRREGAGVHSAARRVDHHFSAPGMPAPAPPCMAFVRALPGGWLELTCPHDGDVDQYLFAHPRVDLIAPKDRHLLRMFVREVSQ